MVLMGRDRQSCERLPHSGAGRDLLVGQRKVDSGYIKERKQYARSSTSRLEIDVKCALQMRQSTPLSTAHGRSRSRGANPNHCCLLYTPLLLSILMSTCHCSVLDLTRRHLLKSQLGQAPRDGMSTTFAPVKRSYPSH